MREGCRTPKPGGGGPGPSWLAVTPLNSDDFAAVTPLTFPAFRPHLARCLAGEAHEGSESIALVARDDGIPVGLVLALSPVAVDAEGNAAGSARASRADGGASPQSCTDPMDQTPCPARAEIVGEGADGHTRGRVCSPASVKSPGKTARLLSISVVPAWRQRGAATRLMMAIEDELRQRGCVRFATSYTTRLSAWQAFERLLAACRWSAPEIGLLMSVASIGEVMKAPWLAIPLEPPPGFELFEWTQLSVGERSQLQQEVTTRAIPGGLSPLGDEEEIERAISVGVRYQGEVVAWMIVIRSPWVPEALCYRSLFVRPQLRTARALGPLVMAAAVRRHAASPIRESRPLAVFGMSLQMSAKMINFFRKRVAPYCSSTYESRAAMKALA